MRKLTALAAAVAVVVLAACSSTPAQTDPYQVVTDATHASYGNLVQLNLGLDGTSSGQSVHVDPSAIRLIVDTKAGKADFAVSLPLDSLQIDAATRAQLGLTGSTLDLEVLYDGAALYAKSPVLQPLLTALLMQTGTTPGDLSGWVKLGTAQELAALGASIIPQASMVPSVSGAPAASVDAATMKTDLENAGITLTYVGQEQRGGQKVDHISATFDSSKLQNSPVASDVPSAQLSQVEGALAQFDMTPDLWFAADTHQLTEVDLKLTPKAGSASPAASGMSPVSLTLLVSTPADDRALQTPSNATSVSIGPIIQSLLQSFGGGLFNTTQ